MDGQIDRRSRGRKLTPPKPGWANWEKHLGLHSCRRTVATIFAGAECNGFWPVLHDTEAVQIRQLAWLVSGILGRTAASF